MIQESDLHLILAKRPKSDKKVTYMPKIFSVIVLKLSKLESQRRNIILCESKKNQENTSDMIWVIQ